MKWNNQISHLSAARQIPESKSYFVMSRVCPMVSVRGKTPIPMTPWGYSCHTRGNRQSELFKMEHVQMGNSILLMTWDTGGNLNSLVCHQQDCSLSNSQVPLLSICGHVSISRKREVLKPSSRFLPRAFWITYCLGTGHKNPLWEFQSEATIEHVVNVS